MIIWRRVTNDFNWLNPCYPLLVSQVVSVSIMVMQ